jgi:hypothetical protein
MINRVSFSEESSTSKGLKEVINCTKFLLVSKVEQILSKLMLKVLTILVYMSLLFK